MADTKILNETIRSPVDGSESVRLATTGANWRATLLTIEEKIAEKYRGTVNVATFSGVDPTGATDSTAGIQAAIDYAFTNHFRRIFLPSGQYVTSLPLFVDPPGNLRGSPTAWNAGTAYVVGNVVGFNGIPWTCNVANTGQTPILPPRVSYGPGGFAAIPANSIVEYRTQYWKNISGTNAAQGSLTFGSYNSAIWQNTPIYWLPTTVSPTSGNFSPIFEGVGMDSSQNNVGTIIRPTFSNAMAIIVGPGQGVEVTGLQIIGPTNPGDAFGYDSALSPNGVGIALTGPGSSRSLIDKCGIYNYYSGVKTGANGDGNCDSNTIRKCTFQNCYKAADFAQTQNFVNRVDDCQVNARIGVACAVGNGAVVTGGIFSLNINGTSNKAYTISSVSMASNGNVTATVSSPDDYLAAHAFNRFALVTPFYGVLPFTLTSYVEATGVITLGLSNCYLNNMGGTFTAPAELQTEIAALTTLYAAKSNIAYFGTGIRAYGVHHEQDGQTPTTLLWCDEGFGGNPYSFISGLQFNYDPTFDSLGPAHSANLNLNASYYVMMTTPFIYVGSGSVKFEGNTFGYQANTPLLILHNMSSRLEMHNWDRGFFNILPLNGNIYSGSTGGPGGYALGSGEFDRPTSYATQSVSNGNNSTYFRNINQMAVRYWGVRPAPNTTPVYLIDDLSKIEQPTLPVLNSGGDVLPYVLPWGGTNYNVISGDNVLPMTDTQFRSNHFGYTYGQALTINWSFKGGSNVVNFSGGTANIFPGLVLIFSSMGSNNRCIVTGVYDQAKYATVINVDGGAGPILPGTAGTTYSGTVIAQQPFSIQHLNNLQRAIPPTLLTGVSNVQGAYSTRLLNSSYAGAAVNIRRSSDNTTADIGFVLGELDVSAFNTFVGAGQGFVRTWYDQSGGAANLTQTTNANQPQLVLNAAPNGRPALLFNGTTTNLKATLVTGPTTLFTFESVMQILPLDNITIWELDVAGNAYKFILQWYNPNLQFWYASIGAPQVLARSQLWSQIAMFLNTSGGGAFVNGSYASFGSFSLNAGGPTFLTVGANGAATPAQFCYAYIAEMVFINGDFLSTDRPLRQNQRLYWDV